MLVEVVRGGGVVGGAAEAEYFLLLNVWLADAVAGDEKRFVT